MNNANPNGEGQRSCWGSPAARNDLALFRHSTRSETPHGVRPAWEKHIGSARFWKRYLFPVAAFSDLACGPPPIPGLLRHFVPRNARFPGYGGVLSFRPQGETFFPRRKRRAIRIAGSMEIPLRFAHRDDRENWIPACAGMTNEAGTVRLRLARRCLIPSFRAERSGDTESTRRMDSVSCDFAQDDFSFRCRPSQYAGGTPALPCPCLRRRSRRETGFPVIPA